MVCGGSVAGEKRVKASKEGSYRRSFFHANDEKRGRELGVLVRKVAPPRRRGRSRLP